MISASSATTKKKKPDPQCAKSSPAICPAQKPKSPSPTAFPAIPPAEGNYTLLKLLDQASRDLSLGTVEPLDPGDRGAGDIGYISDLLPSLDGIGIGGTENAHAPGEFADLESLPNLIKRSALLIYRLTR